MLQVFSQFKSQIPASQWMLVFPQANDLVSWSYLPCVHLFLDQSVWREVGCQLARHYYAQEMK